VACESTGVEIDGSNVLAMNPPVAMQEDQSFRATISTTQSFGDFDLSIRTRTIEQHRTGSSPKSWEVAWVFFHYVDDHNTYYVILKPSGWEVGKYIECESCPDLKEQVYLATDTSPTFPIGPWSTLRIRQVGAEITVWANGSPLASFVDSDRPILEGTLGLHDEDAHARFDDVVVCPAIP
jgi:hypothetical protein